MDSKTHKAFKILAVEEGTTSVALLHELIADTLVRRGKPVPDTTIEYLKDHHRPLPTPPDPHRRSARLRATITAETCGKAAPGRWWVCKIQADRVKTEAQRTPTRV